MIKKQSLDFLKSIQKNNNKEWFAEHKPNYLEAHSNAKSFLKGLEENLNSTDSIEGTKLFRIYKDVRFSKDKTPYKTYFSGYLKRAGADRRGSYYFSIEPGNTIVGGGFYGPNKEDLLRIRKEFEMDASEIEKITSDKTFKKYFGELQGDGVATAPRGFDKEHPNIRWIRKKQFYAFRKFTDKEVLDDSFVVEVLRTFAAIRLFFDYMSEVLTTDLNGESIL